MYIHLPQQSAKGMKSWDEKDEASSLLHAEDVL